MSAHHTVKWIDRNREPQCPPNPAYPDGCTVDLSLGAQTTCGVKLPYPAKRCGVYTIKCRSCGLSVGVTTAGRPDDPRHVILACKELLN